MAKPVNLAGRRGAHINAKGQPPLKIGKMKLPGSVGIGVLATSHVSVRGFNVTGAGFDAILVALSSHVTVSGNVLTHNGEPGRLWRDRGGHSTAGVTHNLVAHNVLSDNGTLKSVGGGPES